MPSSIDQFLQVAIQNKASDIYLISDKEVAVKIEGQHSVIAGMVVAESQILQFINEVVPPHIRETVVNSRKEADIVYAYGGFRFRVNIHYQVGLPALSIRLIPENIPEPEFLNFPEIFYNIPTLKQGIVLLTGSTASGKSSVLAALVNMINKTQAKHIITIEDPIEFVYPKGMSIIEQRQVGVDTQSFADALRASFRQDPDVILVGELRDQESIATALNAAETGHLVFATLHSSSTVEALTKIINTFSPLQQPTVIEQLASFLVAVVSRELLPRKGGGPRVASWEVMLNTAAVSSLIRERKFANIYSLIQTGSQYGMITMEQSKSKLRVAGLIE